MAFTITGISRKFRSVAHSSPRRQMTFLLVAFFFVLLCSTAASPLYASYGNDSVIFQIVGTGITRGLRPYHDLFDHKGPLLFYIYALAEATGCFKWAMTAIQTVFMFFTINIVYSTCRLMVSRVKSLAILALTLAFAATTMGDGSQSEFFGLPFISMSLYLTLKAIKSGRVRLPLLTGLVQGICIGVAAMLRINDAVSPPGIALLASMIYLGIHGRWSRVWRLCIGGIVGACLVIIPIFTYFTSIGLLLDLWYGMIEFNLKYVNLTWANNYIMKFAIITFMIVASVAGAFRNDTSRRVALWLLIPVLVMCAFTIGNRPFIHYYLVLTPVFAIVCTLICNFVGMGLTGWLVVLGGWNVSNGTPLYGSLLQKAYFNYSILKKNDMHRRYHRDARRLLEYVPAADRDKIWNLNLHNESPMDFFPATGTTPANRFFVPMHTLFDPKLQTTENVFVHKPEWVIANDSFNFLGTHDSTDSIKTRFLHMYSKVGTIRVDTFDISLYRIKER